MEQAVIPTGFNELNRAIGTGGYPRGRIVEVFGPELSGKTTLVLNAIASVQQIGGTAALIDAEHTFDLSYAKATGIDPALLLISQPDYGEQALEIAELLTKSTVDLVAIDSVAALVPRAEIEGDMGEPRIGLRSAQLSWALRRLTAVAHRTNTTIIFTNQVFSNPETTPGGNALKFYASVRIDVRPIGEQRYRARVVKNKCAQPFAEAEFGIDST